MTIALAQRLIALAGIALLAVLLALALKPGSPHGPRLPGSVPPPGGGWNTNLMAPRGDAFTSSKRSCGFVLSRRSLGLSSPVYPCRTKIWLHYNGVEVLTQVIARNAPPPGSMFELSPTLAAKLGLSGTQEIDWRFAVRS